MVWCGSVRFDSAWLVVCGVCVGCVGCGWWLVGLRRLFCLVVLACGCGLATFQQTATAFAQGQNHGQTTKNTVKPQKHVQTAKEATVKPPKTTVKHQKTTVKQQTLLETTVTCGFSSLTLLFLTLARCDHQNITEVLACVAFQRAA